MALPEKRIPDQPNSYLKDIGDQRTVERVSRSGWRWWWVWPVIIALAIWWAGWGWGGTGGWWWGRQAHSPVVEASPGAQTAHTLANAGAQQPAVNTLGGGPQPMSGDGLDIITSQDKQPFIGHKLAANDLPVHHVVSDKVLWVGERYPILAVVTGQGPAQALVRGQLADAIGTVEKAPSEARAKHEWKLDAADASRLEKEGVYLNVGQISIPPQ